MIALSKSCRPYAHPAQPTTKDPTPLSTRRGHSSSPRRDTEGASCQRAGPGDSGDQLYRFAARVRSAETRKSPTSPSGYQQQP